MPKYQNKQIEDLSAELSAGLRRLKKSYVDAAESLVQMIEPDRDYPFEFVIFRITGYRTRRGQNMNSLVSGKTLRRDLLQLMIDVSDSFDLRTTDYAEPVYDNQALASHYSISLKTVQRWRNRCLPSRRMIFPDSKRRLAFLDSSVRWFVQNNRGQVVRSMKFTQLTLADRNDIIRRARRMISFTNCTLSDVARRLATRTGRAVETVRYTIRKHDIEHPDDAIFPNLTGPLDEQERSVIYRNFISGMPVPAIAKQYRRTRGSIYRIINEMRALQLLQRPIAYIHNTQFDKPNADAIIMAGIAPPDPPERGKPASRQPRKSGVDLPPYLSALYEVPLLAPDLEADLFRRYNYLKYKADKLRKQIDMNHVRTAQLKEIENLLLSANVIKNRIVRSNLRLVVSIAKKHMAGPLNLFELISDGNVSLMRAVEKFDYSRGYRFSTYASWAIMRNFARSVPREKYQLDRFATGHDEVLEIAAGLRGYDPAEMNVSELRESIDSMLTQLSPRERAILIDHYGLDETVQPKTFDQLGQSMGISKERVRQIELQALKKLRDMVEKKRAEPAK
ncbi:MAG: sigma-70 family RNA polymerase sigma factor [Planctomycetes bacterium]|nr:sigma-70 family RNA polymerase sigma factor [Planctomycetota bacterium]